ncbi:hypothetical protein [Collimonas fungivorans]|uniref:hypothetical protein n=1 Tax=Collimonas fungivorans TaxID=158899 RepID=UPI0011D2088D|nr:hypothetical protein [Collimonas fungivorans]
MTIGIAAGAGVRDYRLLPLRFHNDIQISIQKSAIIGARHWSGIAKNSPAFDLAGLLYPLRNSPERRSCQFSNSGRSQAADQENAAIIAQ